MSGSLDNFIAVIVHACGWSRKTGNNDMRMTRR